jgi:hypothetical protein
MTRPMEFVVWLTVSVLIVAMAVVVEHNTEERIFMSCLLDHEFVIDDVHFDCAVVNDE